MSSCPEREAIEKARVVSMARLRAAALQAAPSKMSRNQPRTISPEETTEVRESVQADGEIAAKLAAHLEECPRCR